jgi:hypothetical protein
MNELTTKKIPKFRKWLESRGCEMLPATNEYELIRFKSILGTGVIYKAKRGFSVNSPFVDEAVDCFLGNKKWKGQGKPKNRVMLSKRQQQLLDRDGNQCFYCGKEMADNDMTLEHLLSINHGGGNRMENLVLAHKECNKEAGHKSIIEKVKLRDKLRMEIK